MRLIICDKNKLFLESFKVQLKNFLIEKNILVDIFLIEDFYYFLINKNFSEEDLIFLGDIENSNKIIEFIIDNNINLFLVIVSNLNNFDNNYLKINSFGYLQKESLTIESFEKIINSIYINYLENLSHIFFTRNGDIIKQKVSDIIYIGIQNRYVYLKLSSNKEVILKNRNLESLKFNFFKNNFIQIYRGMFVNRKYILNLLEVNKDIKLELTNKEILSVSRNKKRSLKERLLINSFYK